MKDKITERKLKNKRFRKTEEAIIVAFFSIDGILDIRKLLKTAKISRSTLYRHHKTIYEIIPNYEKYILRKYKRIIKRLLKIKNIRLKSLYEKTLHFMFSYKKIMLFLFAHGNKNFVESLLLNLKPKIISTNKISNPEMFDVYLKEVIAVIEKWGRDGFEKTEIPLVVDKIMYLTDTAHIRLGPITNQTPSKTPHLWYNKKNG